jgi:low molecular weight phosphotyrosine protein phosphatase
MAEAVFRHIVEEAGLQDAFPQIDSAGTAGYHVGESPDTRSVKTCNNHGIQVSHKGQKVNGEHFRAFDWLLCMDESNYRDLMRLRPKGATAQVKLFGEFDPNGERIVQDPYYGGQEGFENNYRQCVR